MKELRITAVVPMPDDAMEAGEKMAGLRPHVQALEEALGVKVTTNLVRPVERKKGKADTPAASQPTAPENVVAHPTISAA